MLTRSRGLCGTKWGSWTKLSAQVRREVMRLAARGASAS